MLPGGKGAISQLECSTSNLIYLKSHCTKLQLPEWLWTCSYVMIPKDRNFALREAHQMYQQNAN